jgi:hypothetical protein
MPAKKSTAKKKMPRSTRQASGESISVPAPFRRVAAELGGERGVTLERGWGAGNVVLKVRGKIFAMLVSDAVVLKLPKARVDELVERALGTRFDPKKNGREMKEWIVLESPGGAVELARDAYRFVGGFKAQ